MDTTTGSAGWTLLKSVLPVKLMDEATDTKLLVKVPVVVIVMIVVVERVVVVVVVVVVVEVVVVVVVVVVEVEVGEVYRLILPYLMMRLSMMMR